MTCLKHLRLNTTMYIIVLLNLTGMMYKNFVETSSGDYDKFLVNSESTDDLIAPLDNPSNTTPTAMEEKETECEKDLRWNLLGVPQKIDINELSILQIRKNNRTSSNYFQYIHLSDLYKIDKIGTKNIYDQTQDVVVIIPGFQTSIKLDTPVGVAKLIYTLLGNAEDINLFVFDVDEHFSKIYTYEKCVLKVPVIGKYLGINIAKIQPRPEKKIHFIGIDIGAGIAGIAATHYKNETNKKISRISAINPATVCLKGFLTKDSANFVDVYIGSNLYNKRTLKIGHVNYVIRNQMNKSTCNRLMCASNNALNYYADSILKYYNSFELKECSRTSCDHAFSNKTKYGYDLSLKTVVKDFTILYAEETDDD